MPTKYYPFSWSSVIASTSRLIQHNRPLLALFAGLVVLSCGDDGGDTQVDCQSLCDKNLDCPMDPTAEDCVTQCQALASACPGESKAVVACTVARPASDFMCDDFQETSLKDGICEQEANAIIACALGGVADTAEADTTTDSAETDTSEADTTTDTSEADTTTDTSEADTTDTSDGTAVDPGEGQGSTARCESYCSAFQELSCSQSEADCEADCRDALDAVESLGCTDSYDALLECSFEDIPNNFECDEEGAPVAKDDACQAEQASLFTCVLGAGEVAGGGASEIASQACADYCQGNGFTAPVACPNDDDAAPCETTCLFYFEYFGDSCGQSFIDYTTCAVEAEASHWSCDAAGQASFDDAVCQEYATELGSCTFGISL